MRPSLRIEKLPEIQDGEYVVVDENLPKISPDRTLKICYSFKEANQELFRILKLKQSQ